MTKLVLALLAIASAAHADPTRYLETDVMIGGATPVVGPNILGAVSGGYLLRPNLWGHAEVAAGPAADDQGTGSNWQARAGLEARACTASGVACALAGLDAGVLHGQWTRQDMPDEYERVTAAVLVPRLGFDLGGRSLRARVELEIDEAIAGSHVTSFMPPTTPGGTIGVELAAGAAYQW